MTDKPIKLVQFPRALGVPNASPFCVKLELWLKLAGIAYEIEEQMMPGKAPKKKIPYVEIDGRQMGDSTLIIEHLTKTRNVTLDDRLSPAERGYDQALWAMLDERLYWYAVHDRWLGDGWPAVYKTFFGSMPLPVRLMVKTFAQRSVRKQLWNQGTGRHDAEDILAMAKRDIAAVADILGDQTYIHGDQIRSIDAVVYGTMVNLIQVEIDTPTTRAARTHANLVAYVQRITDRYFSDI